MRDISSFFMLTLESLYLIEIAFLKTYWKHQSLWNDAIKWNAIKKKEEENILEQENWCPSTLSSLLVRPLAIYLLSLLLISATLAIPQLGGLGFQGFCGSHLPLLFPSCHFFWHQSTHKAGGRTLLAHTVDFHIGNGARTKSKMGKAVPLGKILMNQIFFKLDFAFLNIKPGEILISMRDLHYWLKFGREVSLPNCFSLLSLPWGHDHCLSAVCHKWGSQHHLRKDLHCKEFHPQANLQCKTCFWQAVSERDS